MKIGILTFHCAHNYGAVLQAYALQKYLSSQNHVVYIIDYRPEYTTSYYPKFTSGWDRHISIIPNIKRLLMELLKAGRRCRRFNNFESFITQRMNLHPFDILNGFRDFDVIVIGSDQVWNPKITGGVFDKLLFGIGIKTKVISYAASSRFIELSEMESNFFRQNIKNFAHVGVRETRLQKLLIPLSDKTIHVNLDPTLLLTDIDYNRLHLRRPIKNKYITIYEITEHDYVDKIANRIAEEKKLEIIRLVSQIRTLRDKNKDEVASPEKFVSYIKFADYIITTSFHGMAFSIIYKKDFYYVLQNRDADDRIISLLSLLNLTNRIIPQDYTGDSNTPIDWDNVYKLLNAEKMKSKQYLEEALYSL